MSLRNEESMHPVRISPWEELVRLEEAMNRFMDEVFGTPRLGRIATPRRAPGPVAVETWTPAVDIVDKGDRLEIMVYLPGVPRDAIEISMEDSVLRISGHRSEPEHVKPEDYQLCESRYGPFSRSLNLPDGLNLNRVEAVLKDGVLTITIPKLSAKEPKRIEVKPG